MELNTYVIIAIASFVISAIALIISIIIFIQDDILHVFNEYTGKTKERGIKAINEGKKVSVQEKKKVSEPKDKSKDHQLSDEQRKAKAYAHASKQLNSDKLSMDSTKKSDNKSEKLNKAGDTQKTTDPIQNIKKTYEFNPEYVDTDVLASMTKVSSKEDKEYADTDVLTTDSAKVKEVYAEDKEYADTDVLTTDSAEVKEEFAEDKEYADTDVLTSDSSKDKEYADTDVLTSDSSKDKEYADTDVLTTDSVEVKEIFAEDKEYADTDVLTPYSSKDNEYADTDVLCGCNGDVHQECTYHYDQTLNKQSSYKGFKVLRSIIVVHSDEVVTVE